MPHCWKSHATAQIDAIRGLTIVLRFSKEHIYRMLIRNSILLKEVILGIVVQLKFCKDLGQSPIQSAQNLTACG